MKIDRKVLSLSLSLSILFLSGCSNGSESYGVLTNGTVVNSMQKAELDGLETGFYEIVEGFRGSETMRSLDSATANELLLADIKAFMKDNIGADYEDYIIEGEIVLDEIEITADESSSREIIYIQMADSVSYLYRAKLVAKYVSLPWGTWCWANTMFQSSRANTEGGYNLYSNYVVDTGIRTIFIDDICNVDTGWQISYEACAIGDMHFGFFPKVTGTTYHYLEDSNAGSLSRSYNFSTDGCFISVNN